MKPVTMILIGAGFLSAGALRVPAAGDDENPHLWRPRVTKLQLLERSGAVRWKITLEPGQTRVLSYRYERYVPSK